MIFKTYSGKEVELDTVEFHKPSGDLKHPEKMEFYGIPYGLPKKAWELKKALRKERVRMV